MYSFGCACPILLFGYSCVILAFSQVFQKQCANIFPIHSQVFLFGTSMYSFGCSPCYTLLNGVSQTILFIDSYSLIQLIHWFLIIIHWMSQPEEDQKMKIGNCFFPKQCATLCAFILLNLVFWFCMPYATLCLFVWSVYTGLWHNNAYSYLSPGVLL